MGVEERLEKLEAAQRQSADRAEIWKLIAHYARGLDEENDEELAAVFTEDVISESKPWAKGRQIQGRDIVLKSFRNYRGNFKNRKRFITNEIVDFTGPDTADGWANWLVLHSNDGQSYVGWGAYEFEFRRTATGWLISKMIIIVDAMTTLENGWGDAEKLVAAYPRSPKN